MLAGSVLSARSQLKAMGEKVYLLVMDTTFWHRSANPQLQQIQRRL